MNSTKFLKIIIKLKYSINENILFVQILFPNYWGSI